MIGSASYEAHDFTSTTSGGKTISVCNDCGYTKETVQTYTVSYNANGGSGAPASQTKTYDRRMVNNLLYHKCPIISRGRGSLNEFRQ